MRNISIKELNTILENHKHWLNHDCEGWEEMRADLSYAAINRANFEDANLVRADLRYANLVHADLRYADLHYANLVYADLRYANLAHADIRYADLSGANLHNADLRYANLRDADLGGASLEKANLRYATNIPFIPTVCPDCGEFIGWKSAGGFIVKLLIPADAKRSSATSRKCRCNKAKVLAIETLNGKPASMNAVTSNYDRKFVYKVGETVEVKNFDDDRWNECSTGIHFFINRQEAVEYWY